MSELKIRIETDEWVYEEYVEVLIISPTTRIGISFINTQLGLATSPDSYQELLCCFETSLRYLTASLSLYKQDFTTYTEFFINTHYART